jgi:hypothetical protein
VLGPRCWRSLPQVPRGGTHLYVGLIEEAVKLAALCCWSRWPAAAAWRSQPPTPGQRMRRPATAIPHSRALRHNPGSAVAPGFSVVPRTYSTGHQPGTRLVY